MNNSREVYVEATAFHQSYNNPQDHADYYVFGFIQGINYLYRCCPTGDISKFIECGGISALMAEMIIGNRDWIRNPTYNPDQMKLDL